MNNVTNTSNSNIAANTSMCLPSDVHRCLLVDAPTSIESRGFITIFFEGILSFFNSFFESISEASKYFGSVILYLVELMNVSFYGVPLFAIILVLVLLSSMYIVIRYRKSTKEQFPASFDQKMLSNPTVKHMHEARKAYLELIRKSAEKESAVPAKAVEIIGVSA